MHILLFGLENFQIESSEKDCNDNLLRTQLSQLN